MSVLVRNVARLLLHKYEFIQFLDYFDTSLLAVHYKKKSFLTLEMFKPDHGFEWNYITHWVCGRWHYNVSANCYTSFWLAWLLIQLKQPFRSMTRSLNMLAPLVYWITTPPFSKTHTDLTLVKQKRGVAKQNKSEWTRYNTFLCSMLANTADSTALPCWPSTVNTAKPSL